MSEKSLVENGQQLSSRYDIWLCDIWGVVHNGVAAHAKACEALANHRKNGGTVILITNAPRPRAQVAQQLNGLSVPENCYDAIVSSGDVTRSLVADHKGGKVFFLGPERDYALKDGLPVEWSELGDAEAVLCSGLYDDKNDTMDRYADMLVQMKDRNLPMICANPDLVVQFGTRLIPCAGAIAAEYTKIGGEVLMAGKPFTPIYEISIARASEIKNQAIDNANVVAIGDGMNTDIKGACDFGLDVMFISGGIHDDEIGEDGSTQDLANIARDAIDGVKIAGAMRNLEW